MDTQRRWIAFDTFKLIRGADFVRAYSDPGSSETFYRANKPRRPGKPGWCSSLYTSTAFPDQHNRSSNSRPYLSTIANAYPCFANCHTRTPTYAHSYPGASIGNARLCGSACSDRDSSASICHGGLPAGAALAVGGGETGIGDHQPQPEARGWNG